MSTNRDRSDTTAETSQPRNIHGLGLRLTHDPRPDHDPTGLVLWFDGHPGEYHVGTQVDDLCAALNDLRPRIVTD